MKRDKTYPLMKNIAIRLLILLILLFAMLISIYLYSIHVVRESVITAAENEVELYKKDMDDRLKSISGSLDEMLYLSDSLSGLQTTDRNELYFTSMELLDILESKIILNKDAEAFFVVNPNSDIALLRIGNSVGNEQNIQMNQFLKQDAFRQGEIVCNRWYMQMFGNNAGFVKVYKIAETYVGAIILDKSILSCIDTGAMREDSGYILTDDGGRCFAFVGDTAIGETGDIIDNGDKLIENYQGNYVLVTNELEQSKARLTTYFDRTSVFRKFDYIQYGIIGLAVLAIVLLIYSYSFLRSKVAAPVLKLEEATKSIAAGDWDRRVEEVSKIKELKTLEKSFNIMTEEIKKLKIQSYEEKIERQRTELKYLQMQIKPHFYLNALTTVHSMTYKNKNNEIRNFIEALSNHLRYTIRDGVSFVSVEEEVRHIVDYVDMQEIRFPDSVFFMQDVDEEVKHIEIPQLILLTFIENSFKYAMNLEKILYIFVKAHKTEKDGKMYLKIRIEDNGNGFPDDIIRKVNGSEETDEDSGIGMRNIRKTLSLFYEEKAWMEISNVMPSGACTDIWIELT